MSLKCYATHFCNFYGKTLTLDPGTLEHTCECGTHHELEDLTKVNAKKDVIEIDLLHCGLTNPKVTFPKVKEYKYVHSRTCLGS